MSLKRSCLVLAFISIFALCGMNVYAQDSASTENTEWNYYGRKIRSIKFKGLKTVAEKDVDGITSSFIGHPFSDELFSDLCDRIYALDMFDDLEPQAVPGDSKKSTVTIVFTVKEKPVVRKITVTGNKKIRTAEIKDTVSVKEKEIYVAKKLLISERAVRDLYLEKGFTNVRVSSTTKSDDKGIEVIFKVDEGRSTVIKNIEFRGNKNVSSKTLRGKLQLKEAGFFNKGAFQESMLEADKQAILAYYKNNGYIDADIIDVTREINVNEKKELDEMTIVFVVNEGSVYTFGGIRFIGNTIFSDEKLNSLMKIQPGKTFSQVKFQESVMAIANLYYENGYTSNRFNPIENKDSESKVISYTFQIGESVRSHVESITIKGNTRTKEHVIRREIPIESGDIFSKEKITTSLRNLYNLQYFSSVVPDVLGGSEENLVNLVFAVEEQSTTSIEFGVTFSGVSDPDDLPFALFVKWQDSNLRGLGKTVGISSSISTSEQSISLNYGENWLWDQPIYTSISMGFSHSTLNTLYLEYDGLTNSIDDDSYYLDYDQWKWTLGFSLGRRWTPNWAILSLAAGVSSSLINNEYDDDLRIPVDSSVSEYANTWGWSNALWTSFSIDDRDVNYDPSTGWFGYQRFTWYGLTPLETEFFLKTDTKLEKYFTLVDWAVSESYTFHLVLAGYTGLTMEFPVPGTGIGRTSRLYIDGMFNGRGWTNIYNKYRGKALWSSNIELRLPVVPGVLAFDWFGDAAVVCETPSELKSLSVEDFFFSTGPGIRFCIPQFPLRLLFANTFKIEDGSVKWDNNWKFVLSFNVTNK